MPTDSDVLCLRNGTLATVNETAFGSYGSTIVSLVIRCIKMFRLVVVVDLNRKKSTQLCSSWIGNAPWERDLYRRKVATLNCARFSYCSALFRREGRQLSGQQWIAGIPKVRVLRLQALLSFPATSYSRTCSSYCTKPRWSEQFSCGQRR